MTHGWVPIYIHIHIYIPMYPSLYLYTTHSESRLSGGTLKKSHISGLFVNLTILSNRMSEIILFWFQFSSDRDFVRFTHKLVICLFVSCSIMDWSKDCLYTYVIVDLYVCNLICFLSFRVFVIEVVREWLLFCVKLTYWIRKV